MLLLMQASARLSPRQQGQLARVYLQYNEAMIWLQQKETAIVKAWAVV